MSVQGHCNRICLEVCILHFLESLGNSVIAVYITDYTFLDATPFNVFIAYRNMSCVMHTAIYKLTTLCMVTIRLLFKTHTFLQSLCGDSFGLPVLFRMK